ncbi:thioesterase family protein [Hymenobacter aerilatus]|uniref:Thioesterase family protein n=1 Tax=Hymenobacter aerilatus TaxID=2932251 RepID=A0A8T9T002_9BACT|nr:acyl-CoA thioesterase [Hymenobacter aerilatus]UOR07455.1 thioesterase family protein [Hymenobacter aerilatus]
MPAYEKTYTALWADMDPNGHMRHSAYTDYAAHTRLEYLSEAGFTMKYFTEHQLGPILFREDTRFLREVRLGESITVSSEVAGLNADGSRWRIIHTIRKPDGVVAATVTVDGAWLDLQRRKLTVPPAELAAAMTAAARHESYQDIVKEAK